MALPSGKIVAEKCGTIVIDSEKSYQIIFDDYLSAKDSVEVFIQRFMTTWRRDRDANTPHNEKFGRLIDRVFTSCDCFEENPSTDFEISEKELKREIRLLKHIWFG
jgi:hypothetical protein